MKSVDALIREVTEKINKEWSPLTNVESWIVHMAVVFAVELARQPQEEKAKTGATQ